MRIDNLVKRFVVINDSEIKPVLTAFSAFFCVLAAYYLLVPLRDEAAVALGSDVLPRLFGASLLLTLIAAPAASAFLGRPGVSRDRAIRQLYRILAASIIGFAVLYWVVIAPAAPQQQLRQHINDADAAANAAARRQQVARQERLHRGFADAGVAAALLSGSRANDSSLGSARGSAGRNLQEARGMTDGGASATGWGSGGGTAAGSRMLRQIVSLRHGDAALQGGSDAQHDSDRQPGSPQRVLRAAFYLWVSAANLVAVSTMWARAADAFDAGAAARLFGLLGAGATAGQLAGSAVAGAAAAAARHTPSLAAGLPTLLMLGAAGLLAAAGGFAAALAPVPAAGGSRAHGRPQAGFEAVVGGFRLIAASAYLRSIALFVVLLTGRLLRSLSPSCALAALPATAFALMAGVALSPTPATVAGAEVLRKVVAYGIARPAREVLFTVVSRDEKYRAKVVLDTLVQRLGDATAAAAFAGLSARLGPAGFAAAAAPICLAWAALGARLGRQQQALAAGAAAKRCGEEMP